MTDTTEDDLSGSSHPASAGDALPHSGASGRADAPDEAGAEAVVLKRRIGEGAFADVWEGEDPVLGRRIAVKIVRPSMAAVADARVHARALAKVHHPNVVVVHGLARVADPDTGLAVDAVVMEFVDGVTLADVLAGRASLSSAPAAHPTAPADPVALAGAVLDGLEAIHAADATHGDLHAGNVMVARGDAKVLDLFSRGTTAALGTASRDARRRRDVADAREVVRDLLNLTWRPEQVAAFWRAAAGSATVADVRAALAAAVPPADDASLNPPALAAAFARLTEPGFPGDDAYARALLAETPPALRRALLVRLVADDAYRVHHRAYVRAAQESLDSGERAAVVAALAPAIDRTVPDGDWGWPLHMLGALGRFGFPQLPATTRLRLEHHLVRNLREGRHGGGIRLGPSRGLLGQHVNVFWPYLDRARLVDAFVASLRGDWYSQNYVAAYFFTLLPRLADVPEHRASLLGGLRAAVANNAHTVRSYLSRLPADWQAELAAEVAGESEAGRTISME